MIIGIPDELLDPDAKMPSLRQEIKNWCLDHLIGGYPEVFYVPFAFRQDIRFIHHIEFENDNDAVMFKLRWW